MQITIDLPNSLETNNQELLLFEVRLGLAVLYFTQKKVSIEKASPIAQLSVFEFQKESKKLQIPLIDYSISELKDEVKLLKQ
ncbi:MAG: UPF0175 family protein [Leptospiraceae bacterium]|nr:UPF0175 family protein [Leptospiraceae bacterium]